VRGIADLAAGRPTQEAYLVAIIEPRLAANGVIVPRPLPARPKDRLWELLEAEVGDDAHGRYNALLGRLLSFVDALDALHSARVEVSHSRPG
jgi:hypothetical protein